MSPEDEIDLKERNIAYLGNNDDPFLVKISEDFSKVCFMKKNENYIIFADEDGYCQSSIPWIKSKVVEYIFNRGSEFLFVCHDDYDIELDIFSSAIPHFKQSIPSRLDPFITARIAGSVA